MQLNFNSSEEEWFHIQPEDDQKLTDGYQKDLPEVEMANITEY